MMEPHTPTVRYRAARSRVRELEQRIRQLEADVRTTEGLYKAAVDRNEILRRKLIDAGIYA